MFKIIMEVIVNMSKKIFCLVLVSVFIGTRVFANGGAQPSSKNTAQAEFKYPAKQLTMMVAGQAGSNMDILARILAKHLEKKLDNPIIIQNVPGGGGITGAATYLSQPPNTDTILMMPISNINVSPLFQEVPYKADDFIPIIGMSSQIQGVFSAPKVSGIKNFEDLKNFSKGKILKYGSGGPAVWNGLVQAGLYKHMGLQANTVPHNGVGEGFANLLGGTTDVCLGSTSQSISYVLDGSLVPLFVFGDEPYTYSNGIIAPSLVSLGYNENIDSFTYWCIRKGTDQKIVDYLAGLISSVYKDLDYLADMKAQDSLPMDIKAADLGPLVDKSTLQVQEIFNFVNSK
jgi:tripartite-type tricarboxylate transporter receptor subunit TctC